MFTLYCCLKILIFRVKYHLNELRKSPAVRYFFSLLNWSVGNAIEKWKDNGFGFIFDGRTDLTMLEWSLLKSPHDNVIWNIKRSKKRKKININNQFVVFFCQCFFCLSMFSIISVIWMMSWLSSSFLAFSLVIWLMYSC